MAADRAESVFAEHRLALTPVRRAVWEAVRDAGGHPTADRVVERVRAGGQPRAGVATVYQSLHLLQEVGLVIEHRLPGEPLRFEAATGEAHYHVRCERCGAVDDVPGAPLADLEGRLAERTHFALRGHRLLLEGICPDCAALTAP